MPSQMPIVRQGHAALYVLLVALILVPYALAYHFGGPAGAFAMMAAVIVYGQVIRRILVRDHRKGMYLLRQQRYADAIPCFQKSYVAMKTRPWIDRYRLFTLLSHSRISYREMALINEAFCAAQLGEKDRARALYQQTLREFPGSVMAETALKFLA